MIAKAEVRKRLALYKTKLKEEIKDVENEIKRMDNAFSTEEAKKIWKESAEYSALRSRWIALGEVSWDIGDIMFDEMFDDED